MAAASALFGYSDEKHSLQSPLLRVAYDCRPSPWESKLTISNLCIGRRRYTMPIRLSITVTNALAGPSKWRKPFSSTVPRLARVLGHYETLGLARNATRQQVKAKFYEVRDPLEVSLYVR